MKPISELGYEEARDELIAVVQQLEQGGLDLDASLKLWERGEELAKRCEEHFAGARKRVEDALASREPEELDTGTTSGIGGRDCNTFQLCCPVMGDSTLTTELGHVLVTGGSGFVGANLVTELLDRGHEVRSSAPRPFPAARAPTASGRRGRHLRRRHGGDHIADIDTVFHTAAIIDLMGGASVTEEYRQRSFSVNVTGTEHLVRAAQSAG